jgi:hypothetical protein
VFGPVAASESHFAEVGHRLGPAEDLFDAFPDPLTHGVSRVSRRAALGGPPRIIRFFRTGPDEYKYTVHGPGDEDFERLQWLLEQFPNPHRKKGRLWLIV